jgi:hypothetical protein
MFRMMVHLLSIQVYYVKSFKLVLLEVMLLYALLFHVEAELDV